MQGEVRVLKKEYSSKFENKNSESKSVYVGPSPQLIRKKKNKVK